MNDAEPASLAHELARIMEAIEIAGPLHIRFAGEAVAVAADAPNPGVSALQAYLYQHCYCRHVDNASPGQANAEPSPDTLAAELASANASQDRWSAGWQITDLLPAGQIIAGKAALSRPAWPGEFMTHAGPGMPPQLGAAVSLFAPRGSPTVQPGFYIAFGETLGDWHDHQGVVRFYWNVRASGAAELMRMVTATLNRFQVPFQFKCLSHPAGYPRADAAVLYVARRHYRIAAHLVADFLPRLDTSLLSPVPLFTKCLAPGLGFAEDPGNGESFGMHRCRLLAEAAWRAQANGKAGVAARMDTLRAVFDENGLGVDAPYLNRGSPDDYPFPVH